MPTLYYDADNELGGSDPETDTRLETLGELIQNFQNNASLQNKTPPLPTSHRQKTNILTNCIKTANISLFKKTLIQIIQQQSKILESPPIKKLTYKLLVKSIQYNQTTVLDHLLSLPHHYRPNRHENKDFAIRYAAEKNHLTCLKKLIEGFPINPIKHPLTIKRALYTACCFSHARTIDYLIKKLNPYPLPSIQNTVQFALLLSIECNKPRVINHLLNHIDKKHEPSTPQLLNALHTAGGYLALRATKLIAFKLFQRSRLPEITPSWLKEKNHTALQELYLSEKRIESKKAAIRKYIQALLFIKTELKNKAVHSAVLALNTPKFRRSRRVQTQTCFLALKHYLPTTAPVMKQLLCKCFFQAIKNTLFWQLPLDVTQHLFSYLSPNDIPLRHDLKALIIQFKQDTAVAKYNHTTKHETRLFYCNKILHPFARRANLKEITLKKNQARQQSKPKDALDKLMDTLSY
jgi:hypothetical protein